jgi:hypothetical protein
MKTVKYRELVRNPATVGKLKPGDAVQVKRREGDLVLLRPKRRRLTAEEIERDLQALAAGDPKLDVQAVLADLRG